MEVTKKTNDRGNPPTKPETEVKDLDPVIIEYKCARWKLKKESCLTFLIKTLLVNEPGLIAEEKPEIKEDYFAIECLAGVISDCLEYNYCNELWKGRGDSPAWRSDALWALQQYARSHYDELDQEAKDPFYDIEKGVKNEHT